MNRFKRAGTVRWNKETKEQYVRCPLSTEQEVLENRARHGDHKAIAIVAAQKKERARRQKWNETRRKRSSEKRQEAQS